MLLNLNGFCEVIPRAVEHYVKFEHLIYTGKHNIMVKKSYDCLQVQPQCWLKSKFTINFVSVR